MNTAPIVEDALKRFKKEFASASDEELRFVKKTAQLAAIVAVQKLSDPEYDDRADCAHLEAQAENIAAAVKERANSIVADVLGEMAAKAASGFLAAL